MHRLDSLTVSLFHSEHNKAQYLKCVCKNRYIHGKKTYLKDYDILFNSLQKCKLKFLVNYECVVFGKSGTLDSELPG